MSQLCAGIKGIFTYLAESLMFLSFWRLMSLILENNLLIPQIIFFPHSHRSLSKTLYFLYIGPPGIMLSFPICFLSSFSLF